MRWTLITVVMVLIASGCRPGGQLTVPPTAVPSDDLVAARNGFVSTLRVRGPAPQRYQTVQPPAGGRPVKFGSGDVSLKGWVSADSGDGKKQPAVVFLHGGCAFGDGDWEDADPFARAGFVLCMPTLRGENGNPGIYESFLGEVDDAVAAGRFVASLPNVDASNVFLAGHSVGGVLTCLAAMRPSPYKAAAALDGYVDMESWAAGAPGRLSTLRPQLARGSPGPRPDGVRGRRPVPAPVVRRRRHPAGQRPVGGQGSTGGEGLRVGSGSRRPPGDGCPGGTTVDRVVPATRRQIETAVAARPVTSPPPPAPPGTPRRPPGCRGPSPCVTPTDSWRPAPGTTRRGPTGTRREPPRPGVS